MRRSSKEDDDELIDWIRNTTYAPWGHLWMLFKKKLHSYNMHSLRRKLRFALGKIMLVTGGILAIHYPIRLVRIQSEVYRQRNAEHASHC